MTKFNKESFSNEEAFWIMWYFLKEQFDLSNNTFDVSDILGACEPMDWDGTGTKIPADRGMIDFWNEAVEKFKRNGIPNFKDLKK